MYKLWFLNTILYFHYKLEYMLALSNLYMFKIEERKFASSRRLFDVNMILCFSFIENMKGFLYFSKYLSWNYVQIKYMLV